MKKNTALACGYGRAAPGLHGLLLKIKGLSSWRNTSYEKHRWAMS